MATTPSGTQFAAPAESREHFIRRLAFETAPSEWRRDGFPVEEGATN